MESTLNNIAILLSNFTVKVGDFFEGAGQFFVVLGKLIWMLLENIWFTINAGLALFSNLPTMFGWLPAEAFALLLGIITIAIAFSLTGKG